jgi:hypothetical protein
LPLFFILYSAVSTLGEEEDPVDFRHIVLGITETWRIDMERFRAQRLRLSQKGRLILSPQRIPKTIVYVDGTKLVYIVADHLRNWLLDLGYTIKEAVDIVSPFSSYTSNFNKTRILTMFAKESSTRILVATNAISIGMDIRDVDIVIQWGFPLGYQVANLWQHWGRAIRGPNRSRTVILFCPYWAHNSQGCDPGGSEGVSSTYSKGKSKGARASKGGRSGQAISKRVRFALPPDDADTSNDDNILSESN